MMDFILKTLETMGVPGAIIAGLILLLMAAGGVIKALYSHNQKVYGYRLAERDTLNKALTDTATVIKDMQRASEDRNRLTEEQADLIREQTQMFEVLKVTIMSQYGTITDNHRAAAQSVASLADAVRQLNALMSDARASTPNNVVTIMQAIQQCTADVKIALIELQRSNTVAINNALGLTTIVKRRSITGGSKTTP